MMFYDNNIAMLGSVWCPRRPGVFFFPSSLIVNKSINPEQFLGGVPRRSWDTSIPGRLTCGSPLWRHWRILFVHCIWNLWFKTFWISKLVQPSLKTRPPWVFSFIGSVMFHFSVFSFAAFHRWHMLGVCLYCHKLAPCFYEIQSNFSLQIND